MVSKLLFRKGASTTNAILILLPLKYESSEHFCVLHLLVLVPRTDRK